MFSTHVTLQPAEMLAAWRESTVRLVLLTSAAPRLGQEAAVRIQLRGHAAAATVVGTVVSLAGQGAAWRVELAPGARSLSAVRMLLAAARGEPMSYMERSPRYLVRLPVTVGSEQGEVYMTTACVSEGGCELRWSGPPPAVGQGLRLRFRAGVRPTEVQGQVCWLDASRRGSTVGVQFAEARDTSSPWSAVFAEVVKSGAPRA